MMQVIARFLKGLEAPYMVISGGPLSNGKPHTKEEYKSFALKLEEIGAFTRDLGIKTLFHPNLHSFIETRQHLDQLWDVIDKDLVGICMDTAHFYATGSDPYEILRTYLEWTDIIHLKDCKAGEINASSWESHLAFCELGEGVLDIPAMIRLLLDKGYDRLVVPEVDRTDKTPEESFRVNTNYITQELGLKLNP
jgi:inosose dehydratase